jgi:hypothetical protein
MNKLAMDIETQELIRKVNVMRNALDGKPILVWGGPLSKEKGWVCKYPQTLLLNWDWERVQYETAPDQSFEEPKKLTLLEEVREAMNNAKNNGISFSGLGPIGIAQDMIRYNSALESKDAFALADAVCSYKRSCLPPEIPFNELPLGARFSYPDSEEVWIVLERHGRGKVAQWVPSVNKDHQSLCSFSDDDWGLDSFVVVVDDII